MKNNYRYIGLFVSLQEILQCASLMNNDRLDKVIEHPHVTLAYMPEIADESLFGQTAEITLTGYANNGANEGFLVEVSSECDKLNSMIREIRVPHITISVCKDGEAVDTGFLRFEPIEPIKISGVFGGFIHSKEVVTNIN